MKNVVVTGSFDNLHSSHVRFLEEAAKLGNVHVLLWSDETVYALEGWAPKFPLEERQYLLQAIRYASRVTVANGPVSRDILPSVPGFEPELWAVDEASHSEHKRSYCASFGLEYHVVSNKDLKGFPIPSYGTLEAPPWRKKVIVSGCFDWFHSGHVRFFEEVSQLGDLYVVVGHDANIRLLKGEGHPLFSQDERVYMVQAIRYIRQAMISSGHGWMDAEPEIETIRPDIYVVNEDGDVPGKRAFCQQHGMEYVVLERQPKAGLLRRESTELRGF